MPIRQLIKWFLEKLVTASDTPQIMPLFDPISEIPIHCKVFRCKLLDTIDDIQDLGTNMVDPHVKSKVAW